MRETIIVWTCVVSCVISAACATWLHIQPQVHPHYTREQPSYSVKQFCAEHPDVCSKSRLAHYATPSPIPSKGYVVVLP